MTLNLTFVIAAIIMLVSLGFAASTRSWVVRLIGFVLGLGATTIVLSFIPIDTGWRMLITAILFLGFGAISIRLKGGGDRILGIVLLALGIVLVVPAIDAIGANAPGTVWGMIMESFRQGFATLMDAAHKLAGGA